MKFLIVSKNENLFDFTEFKEMFKINSEHVFMLFHNKLPDEFNSNFKEE